MLVPDLVMGSNHQLPNSFFLIGLHMCVRVCMFMYVHEYVGACTHVWVCRSQRKTLDVLCHALRQSLSHWTRSSPSRQGQAAMERSDSSCSPPQIRSYMLTKPYPMRQRLNADLCFHRVEAALHDVHCRSILLVLCLDVQCSMLANSCNCLWLTCDVGLQ